MPSAHYRSVSAFLQENIQLLRDASGGQLENRPLWNICSALLALSDALEDEFIHINTRLTYIQQKLDHFSPNG